MSNHRGPDIPIKEEQQSVKRTNYLLVIAIDEYQHCPKLYNCQRDAERFIQLLTTQYQFDKENLTTLFNEQATEENILDAFKAQIARVGPEDNLVVIYSGHGEYEEEIDEGYWIPVNAAPGEPSGFISNSRIIKYLRAINAHHITLIIDSCFSGSLFNTRRLVTDSSVERLDHIASRWLLTAGRNEVVSDGKPGDNSPFAENILYFLERNERDSLSISELAQYVTNSVVYNARQTPRGEPLSDVGHRGGQFHFHKKGVINTVEDPVIRKEDLSTSPAKVRKSDYRKILIPALTALIVLILGGLAYASYLTFSKKSSQSDLRVEQYQKLVKRGKEKLDTANDSTEVLEAQRIFLEAIQISNTQAEIAGTEARQASLECQNKLEALAKKAESKEQSVVKEETEVDASKVQPTTQPSSEQSIWKKAQQQDTEEAYRRFIQRYPNGSYTERAKEKVAGYYRYKLDFGTSVSKKSMTIRINQGKAPYQIEVKYKGQSIKKVSDERVTAIDLSSLNTNQSDRIVSVIVRDANYKAKGAKTMIY